MRSDLHHSDCEHQPAPRPWHENFIHTLVRLEQLDRCRHPTFYRECEEVVRECASTDPDHVERKVLYGDFIP
jgi:hypothetical protein